MRRPNYLGIVAGSLTFWAFGFVWYGLLFGNAWMAAVGRTPADLLAQTGYWPYLVGFIAGLFMSYGMDNMLWHYERAGAAKGAQVGLLAGVCFAAACMIQGYAYAGRPIALFLVDGGYLVVAFILAGAVVGALRAWAIARRPATAS